MSVRSDRIVNKAGTGAPELSYGVTVPTGGVVVTGVVTATSFSGTVQDFLVLMLVL